MMMQADAPLPRSVVSAADSSDTRYLWLHEGLTEYMSRTILEDIGIVDHDWVVTSLNQDFRYLADSEFGRCLTPTCGSGVVAVSRKR